MDTSTGERKETAGQPTTSFTVRIRGGFWRGALRWAAGLLLVCVMGAFLLSLNVFQLTSPGPAGKTLERALASLTEIDALLLEGEEDLRAAAEQAPDGELRLEHYPIDVPLSASEVEALSTRELRDLILSRCADKFYAQGLSAFQERGGDSADISLLSAPGAVRYTVGLITRDTHDIARVVAASLLGAALVLTLIVVLLGRGYGRLTGLGVVLMAAALPYLVVAVGVRFVLKLASESESDYLTARLYALGKDVAWLPIHTGIAFVLLGVVFTLLGVGLGWIHSRHGARQPAKLPETAG